MIETDQLLSAKDIAQRLQRHVTYVYAMKRRGFRMPGERATMRMVLVWLSRNPHPRAKNHTHE